MGHLPLLYIDLRESEIGNFDVPICSKKNIFGLEVAIDNFFCMKVVEYQDEFCSDELHEGGFKTISSSKMKE